MKSLVCVPRWLERALFMACAFVMVLFVYAETTIGYLMLLALVAIMVRNDWIAWRGDEGRGGL